MAAAFKASPMLLAFPATTFALGTWQVYRLQWKQGLIHKLEERQDMPPVPLDIANKTDMEYRRVQVHGKFDHAQEMRVGPRTHEGVAGFHLVTPFTTTDGKRVLVNRGWVSRAMELQRARSEPDLVQPAEQTVTGLVKFRESRCEERSSFTPDNVPDKNEWFWVDIGAMAQKAHTEPVVIDALDAPKSDVLDVEHERRGVPIAKLPTIGLRNQHLEYALTWYSLTLASLGMIWFTKRGGAARMRTLV
ncbi:surf-like protein [Sorochytrium milnesiophthora]